MQLHQAKSVALCSLSAAVLLAVFACVIASYRSGRADDSIIFEGQCEVAERVNVGIHFTIAAVSFLVILSSDWFLRVIAAPQPADILRAHEKNQWLEIGSNSLKNLRFIPKWRVACWAMLIMSSIPLQLLFNASVYVTDTSTAYNQIVVGQGFLTGEEFNSPGVGSALFFRNDIHDDIQNMIEGFRQRALSTTAPWTRLDSSQCREAYLGGEHGLRDYRDLIVVVDVGPIPNAPSWTGAQVWSDGLPLSLQDPEFRNSSPWDPEAVNSLWSVALDCSQFNIEGFIRNLCADEFGLVNDNAFLRDANETLSLTGTWNFQWGTVHAGLNDMSNFSSAYDVGTGLFCLAEPFLSACKVEATHTLLLIAFLCILVKTVMATIILVKVWRATPIMCLGDMINWTLQHDQFHRQSSSMATSGFDSLANRKPRVWYSSKWCWNDALPRHIWITTYIFIGAVVISLAVILAAVIKYDDEDLGLGAL
jgi:hypothetical protein